MLLHLSDLHFGTERDECLRAIQKFCVQHRPEAVVVSGDLTQRARRSEFQRCREFLTSLQTPYLVVPGNHDIPLYHLWHRLLRPFGLYQLFFGSPEKTLVTAHFYLIGLNSIRRRYHTRGDISVAQIQQVDQQLLQAPKNKLNIIVSHQPFYTAIQDHHRRDCPVRARRAVSQWGEHGLFALLHGHLHHTAVHDLNQLYGLQLERPVYEVHAGTATSYRLYHHMPNSFNVILNDGRFQHYIFDEATREFILKV
ncbi:metallophosphoesterase family protein [Acinetobacter sp. WZC-1]|uniref:metallophosphoesterase family protein n=1 Tax=Acinetobacter sp. WZC-1 TaxID=3459034 RepID=UPI00403DC015